MKRDTLKPIAVVVALGLLGVVLGGCGGSDPVRRTVDFAMSVDPGAGTLSIGGVDSAGLTVAKNGIQLRSGTVVWTAGTSTLSGPVSILNNSGGTILNPIITIPTISDATITKNSPWVYANVANGSESATQAWTFDLSGQAVPGTAFTFTARVTYTP